MDMINDAPSLISCVYLPQNASHFFRHKRIFHKLVWNWDVSKILPENDVNVLHFLEILLNFWRLFVSYYLWSAKPESFASLTFHNSSYCYNESRHGFSGNWLGLALIHLHQEVIFDLVNFLLIIESIWRLVSVEDMFFLSSVIDLTKVVETL